MKSLLTYAAVIGALTIPMTAHAQLVDPQASRQIGRAVGEAAVAAERAADDARIAARQALREARRGYAEGTGRPGGGDDRRFDIASEEDAVEACALAAEDEGYSIARLASVRDIDRVDRTREGWEVQGVLETRESWRSPRRDPWSFRCSVAGGQIVDLQVRDFVARR